MDIDTLTFERLDQSQTIDTFDCGNEDLNDFLISDAARYQDSLLAVTYLVKRDDEVVGYFSLLNDKLSLVESNKRVWRKIKRVFHHSMHRCDYPAVKVGRIAVGVNYQGFDIGTKIMDYVKYSFINKNRTGCAFVTVDSLRKALPFYMKNNFKIVDDSQLSSDDKTIQMYYDLTQLI